LTQLKTLESMLNDREQELEFLKTDSE